MTQNTFPLDRIDEGAHLIPNHMIGAVRRYIMQGIPPGSFLTAVICNDLREAVARADDDNAAALAGWVRFFYNYAPSGCWGSHERFESWLAKFATEAQS